MCFPFVKLAGQSVNRIRQLERMVPLILKNNHSENGTSYFEESRRTTIYVTYPSNWCIPFTNCPVWPASSDKWKAP